MPKQNDATAAPGAKTPVELPAEGYPISQEAVGRWFRDTKGRVPTDRELGAIMDAMAERESTPPREGPNASAAGWIIGPSAAPADRS